jgi:hypothetical protein
MAGAAECCVSSYSIRRTPTVTLQAALCSPGAKVMKDSSVMAGVVACQQDVNQLSRLRWK